MNAMQYLPAQLRFPCDLGRMRDRVTQLALAALTSALLCGNLLADDTSTTTIAAAAQPAVSNAPVTTNLVSAKPPVAAPKSAETKSDSPTPKESKSAAAPTKTDYSSFRVVSDKNIFNGNRGSGSGVRFTSTRSSTGQRSVMVEWFNLVGTLVTSHGPTAFFDGSATDFQTTLSEGESIAGFKVKEILHAGICLEQGTNTLELAVGSGMRREDQGLWKHSDSGMSFASNSSRSSSETESRSSDSNYSSRGRQDSSGRSSRSGSSRSSFSRGSSSEPTQSSSSSSTVGNPSAGDVDAVLKRLMEQREKE
ncbi:MAG: hypothetical protein RLY20_2534 [Verrucomicrobiota bacterium]|jgi:hypothetical protein